jgi:hypothetical protein
VGDVAGLLGVDEPEPDAGASAAEAGLFCEEEAVFGLPPQPTKYIDKVDIKPSKMIRTATLFTRDLLRSSGVNREYEAV